MEIIAYATHSERLFPVLQDTCKQNNVKFTIVGWNNKWKGFKHKANEYVNYLKSLDGNNIVCIIDGFDTICLPGVKDIVNKYRTMCPGGEVLFSRGSTSNSVIVKYVQDKLFSTCNTHRLNSGMCIGKCRDIIDICSKYVNSKYEDDQRCYTMLCNTQHNIKIDVDNEIFLNVATSSIIPNMERLNKLCFISGPGNTDMTQLTKKLGYNIKMKSQTKYKLLTYIKDFTLEILFAIFAVIFIVLVRKFDVGLKEYAFLLSLLLAVIEYELSLKHKDITSWQMIKYCCFDIVYNLLTFYTYGLILTTGCDSTNLNQVNKLYIMNALAFCIFSCLAEKMVNNKNNFQNPIDRLKYLIDKSQQYVTHDPNSSKAYVWMQSNIIPSVLLVMLNLHCHFSQ